MMTLPPPLLKASRSVLDLLFPRWCIGCGKEGGYICPSCAETLPSIMPPSCTRCGRPLIDGESCSNCSSHDWMIDSIRAPYLFTGIIRQAVHQFKYRNLRAIAPVFAGLLHHFCVDEGIISDAIVPVPLHPVRLRERGYNQSALVAHGLSSLLHVPVVENSLVRESSTPPLASSASREQRLSIVAGAFSVRGNAFSGLNVLLIDDVSTSGATLDACARTIKSTGAISVHGLVLALEL